MDKYEYNFKTNDSSYMSLFPSKYGEYYSVDDVEPLIAALKEIASYGIDGICQYGCDTPHIAKSILEKQKISI